jgi:hypothetical protein
VAVRRFRLLLRALVGNVLVNRLPHDSLQRRRVGRDAVSALDAFVPGRTLWIARRHAAAASANEPRATSGSAGVGRGLLRRSIWSGRSRRSAPGRRGTLFWLSRRDLRVDPDIVKKIGTVVGSVGVGALLDDLSGRNAQAWRIGRRGGKYDGAAFRSRPCRSNLCSTSCTCRPSKWGSRKDRSRSSFRRTGCRSCRSTYRYRSSPRDRPSCSLRAAS